MAASRCRKAILHNNLGIHWYSSKSDTDNETARMMGLLACRVGEHTCSLED